MGSARGESNRSRALPPAAYLDLVKRLPLLPISDARTHGAAVSMIDELGDRARLSPWESGYMSVLALLVEEYESRVYPRAETDGAGVLKSLIDEHGLSIAALGRETGLPASTLSEILSRRRGISPRVRAKLCERFHVGPAAFL